jgi:hypothetical protein
MDLKLRKILRDFITWQRHNDLLKDPLTIDYELAETYLEETEKQLKLYGVVLQSEQLCEHHWERLDLGNAVCDKCGKIEGCVD